MLRYNNRMLRKDRKTHLLRKGRISIPGSRYFLTLCCRRPSASLAADDLAGYIASVFENMEKAGDVKLLAFCIMPDHLHMLICLGNRLTLGQAVGKFKSLTKAECGRRNITWQRNYHEHRLRADEPSGPFARYIFLNPYRAALLAADDAWPHTFLNHAASFDFITMLGEGGRPPREWITCDIAALGLNADVIGE